MKGGKMIKDKRGLSTVVTSLIMILIVLVAIGLIWVVIRNLIGGGAGKIEVNAKCLEVGLKIDSFDCYGVNPPNPALSNCVVVVERVGGLEPLAGLSVVYTNNVGVQNTTNYVGEWDLPTAMSLYSYPIYVVLPSATPMKSVTVIPYFKNAEGEEQFCAGAKATLTK